MLKLNLKAVAALVVTSEWQHSFVCGPVVDSCFTKECNCGATAVPPEIRVLKRDFHFTTNEEAVEFLGKPACQDFLAVFDPVGQLHIDDDALWSHLQLASGQLDPGIEPPTF